MAADNNPINFVLETLQKTGSSLDERYYSGETFDTCASHAASSDAKGSVGAPSSKS